MIQSMTVYSDASGAPAVIESGSWLLAADFIAGAPRLRTIAGPQSHHRGIRQALARAEHAYVAELRGRLAGGYDTWVAANVAMYSEVL